jgi:hypothetical protein
VTVPPDPSLAARALELARAGLARPGAPEQLPERLLVVDAERQAAVWLEAGTAVAAWPVSTARAGIGGEEGSYRTPPGWHRIGARIGADAPPGTVFASRELTGETWGGEPRDEDLILTRILTLDGLEDGVNRGEGRDTLQRYIYLHGTNHEALIGRPLVWLSDRVFLNFGDRLLFDGTLHGLAGLARRAAGRLSQVQSGSLQLYVLLGLGGLVLLLTWSLRHA